MSEQHKGPPAGLVGTVDHQDGGDGWLVVRLMTRQALVREGRHMDHCLADGAYANFAGEEDLAGHSIWSLRDPDGLSVVTLDVRRVNDGRAQVVMATGPGNRDVRRSAARRFGAIVAAFHKVGVALDFAGETKLCVADDGRVMREDRAPAEVLAQVRARHGERIREAGVLPQGRPVTIDEYVRHMQRTDMTAFFDAVGAAMGADTQETREAAAEPPQERTFAMAARAMRDRVPTTCYGQPAAERAGG